MLEMFDTPMRGAALGMGVVAVWILVLSYSDFLLRIFDQSTNREVRDQRRLRFRYYALFLLGLSIALVIGSRLISG